MTLSAKKVLYTIGHSSHEQEHFLDLLKTHSISAVCDVRSIPYSRRNPQFNKDALTAALKSSGIAYVFLGKELGAKDPDRDCCIDGKVQFNLIAATSEFQAGLDRVLTGIEQYKVALLCAEEDPFICHRTILVTRHLRQQTESILHIRGDSRIETNEQFEQHLLEVAGVDKDDLFDSEASAIDRAYNVQGQRISYEFPE